MADDLTLINQFQNQNERALDTIYDRYSGALYGVIIRICKDEALSQDVLQDTFLKIWQKASSYDSSKGRFYTWAYRIARNTALNSLRNRPDLIQIDDLSVYDNREEEQTNSLDLSKLKGSVAKLESHHRKAIELIYFKGLTHREAHKIMKVPLGTFKSYVQQAMKNLRISYELLLIQVWILIESLI